MRTRLSIAFPYAAVDPEVFGKLSRLIEVAAGASGGPATSSRKPLLVVNKDSVNRGSFDGFLSYCSSRCRPDPRGLCQVEEVYAVDTCQMWLAAFGIIIDENRAGGIADDAVLQVPGDLTIIPDVSKLFETMHDEAANKDFVVGDYETAPASAKCLIDLYGTYPLLYNWFPAVATSLRDKYGIKRPRSEIFLASVGFLEAMLGLRKFAYEQTLAFLIYAVNSGDLWRLGRVDLGPVGDYDQDRGYREAVDQIERAERMLKVLWRDLVGGDTFNVEIFEALDRRSTAIREAALVSFWNMLAPPGSGPKPR